MLGGEQIWRVIIIYILSFSVMDALNSCSWCGRVAGETKGIGGEGEHRGCFWCDNRLAFEGVNTSGDGGECVWRYRFG